MKTSSANRAFNLCFLLAFGLAFRPVAVQAQSPIACGQTIAGSIATAGETNQYTFAGTNGEAVILSFANTGGQSGWNPVVDVYFGATHILQLTSDAATNLVLAASGSYKVLVHDETYANTGSYGLSIQSFTGGGCDSTSIACGQTVTNQISLPSEMDAYDYVGSAGQTRTFVLYGPINCSDAGAELLADIYNPSGQLLVRLGGAPCAGSSQSTNLTLTASGSYTVLVHANNYGYTGVPYGLSIQSFTGGGCDSTPIACGQTVTNQISLPSEMDAYDYVGSAGQTRTFVLYGPINCSAEGAELLADIYSPSGQLLVTLTGGACAPSQSTNLTLTASGSYTVLVHANNYGYTGVPYGLSIQSFTGGGCDSTPIACGQTGSGDISQAAEIDAYLINGCSGEVVQLSTSGFGGSQFDLYDPTGTKLFSIGPSTATNITFSVSGIYTLLVHSGNYTGTGSYSATFTCLVVCNHTTSTSSSPPNGGSTSGGGTIVCCIPVTVCAEPAPCYNFVNWTLGGNPVSTSICYTFTATNNSTLTANFAPTGGKTNQICNFQVIGTNAAVSAQSVAGDNYQLQTRSSMTTGSWANISGVVLSNSPGGLIILTNFGGAVSPQKFYRLDITP